MDSTTPRSRGGLFVVALAVVAATAAFLGAGPASAATPNFGPNVIVLNPSMPQAAIQTQLDAISTQQVPNQFGTQRYSIFFQPGTYGSAASPLVFQLGYYTQVAGLGAQPGDVVINGAIDVFNQCTPACEGLNNFWRSVSNLTLNVHLPAAPPAYAPNPGEDPSCLNSNDLFAVSQASPVRRVIVNGNFFLQDYCGEGFTSGGFFADDAFNGGIVCNCSQQQFFTRNSNIDFWTNSVWNQVFLGNNGAPPQDFGNDPTHQFTTLPATPVSQEAPFLYTDAAGNYNVFVPVVQHNSVGPSYAAGPAAGSSLPISRFFIASPSTSVVAIDAALLLGKNLILTPGVYNLDLPIVVVRPDTIVLGLGFATLIPKHGNVAIQTANVPGIKLSGLIVDAGSQNSPALVQLGTCDLAKSRTIPSSQCVGPALPAFSNPNDPTLVQDVFFRIGGAAAGEATNSLIVNTNNTILDDVWAWRADHGTGVGWTTNTADTGLIVNGDNVNAYGLFVEHYQKNEVIWNGQNGEVVFFQNEMPYDPPSQAAWMSSPTTNGYPAFLVSPNVTSFQGYGMGSYSFFNQGVPIFAMQAFKSPSTAGVQFHDLLTIFLDAVHGSGGISSVINGVGGSSTAANADVPVDVISYP
jgi:hypothetical protein